jgi:hypothetical protein
MKKRTKEAHLTDRSGEPKAKKAKPESTLPGQFATWTRKQAELRAEEAMEIDEISTNVDARQSFLILTKYSAAEEADKENSVSAGSTEDKLHAICFLCATTFPQTNVVAHVGQSNIHRQRLEDTHMLDSAYALMKSLGIEPEQMLKVSIDTTGEGGDYVDRAKMRREVEKQRRRELKAQAKSAPKIKMSLGGNALDDDHGKTSLTAPCHYVCKTIADHQCVDGPASGIGASMLKKHGWSEGQGLGAGNGRTAPIEQNMYAAGVGLGHESSRKGDAIEEANRLTKGEGSSFADATKNAARQRFHDMTG